MAMRIRTEECTGCRLCVELCPADCIETDLDHLEGRETLVRKRHALVPAGAYEALVPTLGNGAAEYGEPDA
jgi:formate hydrogenlyase subunit 6/NADH:ubiquinone oxidoreductase subunit I